jgi:hypothetical protein
MSKVLLALVVVLLSACAVPTTIAVSPDFTADQATAVRDALATWCEARGECLTEVPWGSDGAATIRPDARYRRHDRAAGSCGFTDGAEARMNVEDAGCFEDLHVFWRAVAHEIGHILGHEHGGQGLMSKNPDPYGPTDGSDF